MADLYISVTLDINRECGSAKASIIYSTTESILSLEENALRGSLVSINDVNYNYREVSSGTPFERVYDIISTAAVDFRNSLVSLNDILAYRTKMYLRIFDEDVVVSDLAKYDGLITNDYIDDQVTVTDAVETSNINYLVEFDELISVTDKNYNVELFDDSLKVYDAVATTLFKPDTQKMIMGTQFYLSSQHPSPGTFVHVYKKYSHPIMVDFVECIDTVELIHRQGGSVIFDQVYDGGSVPTGAEPTPIFLPNGNLPDNYAIAGVNGSFIVKGLSLGVYVMVSVKPGYTIGWKKVDLTTDVLAADLFLAPIQAWNYVEKIYNIQGHVFKMYHVSNYVDPVDGNRVVDGLLIFGDLYAEGTQENATAIDSSGYLEIDTTNNPGQLYLMEMPDLGKQGFFEIEQGEQVWGNDAHTRISWVGNVRPREFDGFAFRMRFPPDSTGILNLSIATGVKVPMPYGKGAPSAAAPGAPSSGSSGGWGSSSAQGASPSRWSPSGPSTGGGATGSNGLALPPTPPPWNPSFDISFSEGLSVYEEDMSLKIRRGGAYVELLSLVDTVQVDEDFGTPPTLSMHGVALDEAGNPVVGATVHIIATRNEVIVGSTTSDANGLWKIDNLESELEYRITISAPLLGLYSTSSNIQVYDKDVVDSRAWQIMEAQSYNVNSGSQFLDARIILPPMRLQGIADGRIWGEVYDAASNVSLKDVLVEAYPGWLTEGELALYTAQMKSDTTGTRALFIDGYFEIFVPKGKWTVRARKGKYSKSQTYFVEMTAGYNLDIPIAAQVLAGMVYDRDRFNATGEKIPIAGALVSIGEYSAVSDASGNYNLVAVIQENQSYTITTIANGYVADSRFVVFANTDSISGFDIPMTLVKIYGSPGGI